MKNLKNILKILLIIQIIIFSINNVSFAQKSKSIEENTLLKLNGYTIVSPSGDDWEYFITPDKNQVQFSNESSSFLTGKENLSIIIILKDTLFNEIHKTEKEYADEFLEENLNDFQSLDRFMKVNRSRRFDTTIAGNTYYALSFSANNYKNVIPPTYSDILCFMYFPDDFNTGRIFYQFNIISYYNLPLGKKNSNSSDLKPIFSIMKSIKREVNHTPDIN